MKIIKIINNSSVVVNAGKNEGIKEDELFKIMGEKGVPVTDPDTGKELGTLDAIKGIVKATHVYDKISILETEHSMRSMLINPLVNGFQERLKVDNEQITGGMPNDDDPVKIGDEVVNM